MAMGRMAVSPNGGVRGVQWRPGLTGNSIRETGRPPMFILSSQSAGQEQYFTGLIPTVHSRPPPFPLSYCPLPQAPASRSPGAAWPCRACPGRPRPPSPGSRGSGSRGASGRTGRWPGDTEGTRLYRQSVAERPRTYDKFYQKTPGNFPGTHTKPEERDSAISLCSRYPYTGPSVSLHRA
jgi:hypothetical protein